MSRELGRRWALLDKKVKESWKVKGELRKTEYYKAMRKYKSSGKFLLKNSDEEQKMESKKMSQEPVLSLALKKPFNLEAEDMEDYFTFLAQNWRSTAATNPGVGGLQVQILLMERWGNGPPAENETVKRQKKETRPSDGVDDNVGEYVEKKRLAVEQEIEVLNQRRVKQAVWAKWQAMGEEERAKL